MSVDRPVTRAAGVFLPLASWLIVIAWLASLRDMPLWAVLCDAALLGAAVVFVAARSRTSLSPSGAELRRRLHWARRFFVRELGRPRPALRDEWIPYLIALGLGEGWTAGCASMDARSAWAAATATQPGGAHRPGAEGAEDSGVQVRRLRGAALGTIAASVSSSSSEDAGSSGSGSGGGGGGGW